MSRFKVPLFMEARDVFNEGDTSHRIYSLFGKLFLLGYIALIAFPYRFSPVMPGLDSSWIFAINYFFDRHIVFGRDVIWTYGPLGFLAYPQNIGINLDIATGFQIFLWVAFIAFMAYIAIKNHLSLLQLFLFSILFSGGQALYYFGYIGFDCFINFLVFLFLSLAFFKKRWWLYYILVVLLSVMGIFIKCSSVLYTSVAIFGFVMTMAFFDRKKALSAFYLALSIPLLFVGLYLVYCPSFSAMLGYLRGTYELVSGYNVAISLTGSTTELVLAFVTIMLYALFIFFLYKARQASFLLSVMLTGPLIIAFKHGFTRQGVHTLIFFSFVLLCFALVILFTDIRKFLLKALVLILIVVAIWVYIYASYSSPPFLLKGISGLVAFNNMRAAVQYIQTKKALDSASEIALKPQILPQELVQKIGTKRIGIFPWEISYVAANNTLNYVPFPVFQAYSAYTPYLDFLNAEFLENKQKAPELILMEWKSIDSRHPLADVSAMWLSTYKWYDAYERNNNVLILKRRDTPRFNRLEFVERRVCGTGEIIDLPNLKQPVVVKITMKLNIMGRIAKVLYRVPTVRMALVKESGLMDNFRIVPDTLKDGLLMNILPLSLDDVDTLLSEGWVEEMVRGFKIFGEGLSFFEPKISVEFYKISEITVS
jgi:hypothetical protein